MADTPSSILLLRLQSTGSNTNLWGGYLNTALQTIERAGRGYEAYTVTGSATISWTNYSAANSFAAMFTKTAGAPTAAYTITLPSYQTFQGVWNNSGHAGTFKNSGGTGVTVPTNRKALLFGDATDIYEASPNWLNNPVTTFANAGDIVTYNPMVTYVTAAITAASTALSGAFYQRFVYTAAGAETSVSGADDNGNTLAYTPGYCEVFLNGAKLVTLSDAGSDYVATTGTSITGLAALETDDVVEIIAPASYAVADTYTRAQTDALFGAPPVGVGSNTPTTGAFTSLTASTITASGAVTPQALLDISGASAGQIKFPATQNASSDANTLDDYEEGTCTPTLTLSTAGDLSVAYSVQVGFYTKIGNLVTVWADLVTSTWTHTTASGTFLSGSLPFTPSSTTNREAKGATSFAGVTLVGHTQVVARIIAGNGNLRFAACGSGTALGNLGVTNVPSATQQEQHFTISYGV